MKRALCRLLSGGILHESGVGGFVGTFRPYVESVCALAWLCGGYASACACEKSVRMLHRTGRFAPTHNRAWHQTYAHAQVKGRGRKETRLNPGM